MDFQIKEFFGDSSPQVELYSLKLIIASNILRTTEIRNIFFDGFGKVKKKVSCVIIGKPHKTNSPFDLFLLITLQLIEPLSSTRPTLEPSTRHHHQIQYIFHFIAHSFFPSRFALLCTLFRSVLSDTFESLIHLEHQSIFIIFLCVSSNIQLFSLFPPPSILISHRRARCVLFLFSCILFIAALICSLAVAQGASRKNRTNSNSSRTFGIL